MLPHWNYFLAVESDLEILSRYVEFSTDNYKTYSLEMTRIILAAASECDVLAKLLCKKIDSSSKADSIIKYRTVIKKNVPNLPSFEVEIPRWGMKLTPWSNWNGRKSPDWWTANNKIKHDRGNHFHESNLHNVLNSVAALFVLNLYFYPEEAEEGRLLPMPALFRPGEDHFEGTTFDSYEIGINYSL